MLLNNLIEIRKDYGLSQKQIAIYLLITRTTYNAIEMGIREIKIDELCKLSILFNVELLFLIDIKRVKLPLSEIDKQLLQKIFHISNQDIINTLKQSKYHNQKTK